MAFRILVMDALNTISDFSLITIPETENLHSSENNDPPEKFSIISQLTSTILHKRNPIALFRISDFLMHLQFVGQNLQLSSQKKSILYCDAPLFSQLYFVETT